MAEGRRPSLLPVLREGRAQAVRSQGCDSTLSSTDCYKESSVDISQNLLLKMRWKSNHRPVLCVLDLDVLRVDAERRGRVFEEVVNSVGPTDGSVMLKVSKRNNN